MRKSLTSTTISTPTLTTEMNFPTETVNVLPHLNELKETWRRQDFCFTKDQQLQYDMLLQARRERVSFFYEADRVFKGPRIVKEKVEEQEEE